MSGSIAVSVMDERTRRTRNALARALVALSRDRPVDNITVRDLCEEAGIVRSTFYAQFANMAGFLRTSYATMLWYAAMAAQKTDGASAGLATRLILEHMAGSDNFGATLRQSREWPGIFAAGQERLRTIAEHNLETICPGCSPDMLRLAAAYIVGGFFAMVQQWDEGGSKEPPEIIRRAFEELTAPLLAELRKSGPARPAAARC